MVERFPVSDTSLNSVNAGLALAHGIIVALRRGAEAEIDARSAERMTPSYANALVMTILQAVGEDVFSARVRLATDSEPVREAWARAAGRYARGIRLSTQRPGAA